MENATLQQRTGPQKELLGRLKLEQMILERGGYGCSVSNPREAPILFRDSVSCLNFGKTESEPRDPCGSCWLMDFVPSEHHGDSLPCHHILLNEKGETVASLTKAEDKEQLQEAVGGWLRTSIASLEGR